MWRRPYNHRISNVLATSGLTAPLSLFCSKFLGTLSTRRTSCSAVLCLGPNPNCSLRRNLRPLTSLRILVSRILSNSLPFVSSRLTDRNEIRTEPFLGFNVEVTPACFHAGGKYCIWEISFTNRTRKDMPLAFGRTSIYGSGLGFPRNDYQYTGSHSPFVVTTFTRQLQSGQSVGRVT